MKGTKFLTLGILLQLLMTSLLTQGVQCYGTMNQTNHHESLALQDGSLYSLQPIYLRLQTEQPDNFTLWESIPQNMTDHVATISVNVLAVFVSSKAVKTDLWRDAVGNLWLKANFSANAGDYVSTLTWVARKTIAENTSIPDSVPFPQDYPVEVQPFLQAGAKIPAESDLFKQIAQQLSDLNMIQTVRNVLNFVNGTQSYNREKVRLLMNGSLVTSDMLDFVNDPEESLATNNSFCFERAILAATILRAAHVPARTFTNDDLKTWIQVWLPQIGWVDGEVLCIQPQMQPLFPRSLSVSIPRMIENASEAVFPFTWLPKIPLRVANLTMTNLGMFDINQHRTVLCQPTDIETYMMNPDSFSFPIIFQPDTIEASLTVNNSEVSFHVTKNGDSVSKKLVFGATNTIEFEDLTISFTPALEDYSMVALNDFSVQKAQSFDLRIIYVLAIAVPLIVIALFYRNRRSRKSSLDDHGKLISSEKS